MFPPKKVTKNLLTPIKKGNKMDFKTGGALTKK